jgi:hypothetical protein
VENIRRNVVGIVERAILFVFSTAIAFLIATTIELTTGNPFNISNVANQTDRWNPETNFAQILAVVVLTLLIFWGLSVLNARFRMTWLRVVVSAFSAFVLFLGQPMHAFTYFDGFHVGEQLAPSLAFMNGKAPFLDIYMLHGAGEDIFKPAIGFLLFNGGEPSIGAYFLIVTLGRGLAMAGFFTVIAFLLRSQVVYLASALLFVVTAFDGFGYSKTIPLLIVVMLFWLLARRRYSGRVTLILLAAAGFVASLSILNSIDIGALLGAVSAGLAVLLLFVRQTDDGRLRFGRPRFGIRSLAPGIALTVGVIVGQLITFLILLPFGGGYGEFLNLTFLEIPRYQGLTWNYPLPDVTAETLPVWLPAAVFLLGALLAVAIIRADHIRARFVLGRSTLFLVVLLAIAVVYFRFAYGRPDEGHIDMAMPFVMLAAFAAVDYAVRAGSGVRMVDLWPVPLIAIVLLSWPGIVQPTRLYVTGTTAIDELRAMKNLPNQNDEHWMTADEVAIRDYVDAHSDPDDSIFVVAPQPQYYYFTDRENPTRFAISWYIDPQQYTDETLAALEADPPALIIYDPASPYFNSDGTPITQRFPEVAQWITQNYPNSTTVGKLQILSP